MAEQGVHRGGCHCGRVRWEVDADLQEASVLYCNCSICEMKGYLHLIVDADDFQLLSGADVLSEYRFNTETAVHKFCEVCGMHSFYTPRSHPDGVDVNVRCIDGVELDGLEIESFDGAQWEEHVDEIR